MYVRIVMTVKTAKKAKKRRKLPKKKVQPGKGVANSKSEKKMKITVEIEKQSV